MRWSVSVIPETTLDISRPKRFEAVDSGNGWDSTFVVQARRSKLMHRSETCATPGTKSYNRVVKRMYPSTSNPSYLQSRTKDRALKEFVESIGIDATFTTGDFSHWLVENYPNGEAHHAHRTVAIILRNKIRIGIVGLPRTAHPKVYRYIGKDGV